MDLHENWTFKILVPRSSLLVARCLSKQYLRFVTKPADKSIIFNKNDGIPATRASQWQAGLILISNQ